MSSDNYINLIAELKDLSLDLPGLPGEDVAARAARALESVVRDRNGYKASRDEMVEMYPAQIRALEATKYGVCEECYGMRMLGVWGVRWLCDDCKQRDESRVAEARAAAIREEEN